MKNTKELLEEMMIVIEQMDMIEDKLYNIIEREFSKYAENAGVSCNFKEFSFVAKDENKVVGVLIGHSYYREVCISDLIVVEEYRKKRIGTQLLQLVELYFKDNNFDNINLCTYGFQALEFYKKNGYHVEYSREYKKDPRLSKYFLVKYF